MHVDTDLDTQVRHFNRFLFNLFSPFQFQFQDNRSHFHHKIQSPYTKLILHIIKIHFLVGSTLVIINIFYNKFVHLRVQSNLHNICAMSGLVHIIANIKLPTTDAYDTRDISFLSASLLRHILEDNLKLTGSGVEIGLQSCMLKHHKIFFK